MGENEILIGLLSLVGSLAGTFGGILTSSKLTNFRIEQLEKKVEKHNSVVERTLLLEKDQKSLWKRYEELYGELHSEHEHHEHRCCDHSYHEHGEVRQ